MRALAVSVGGGVTWKVRAKHAQLGRIETHGPKHRCYGGIPWARLVESRRRDNSYRHQVTANVPLTCSEDVVMPQLCPCFEAKGNQRVGVGTRARAEPQVDPTVCRTNGAH